jgi:hypothetical protein
MNSEKQEKTQRNKKEFYKKWWFWAIAILVLIIAFSPKSSETQPNSNTGAESEKVVEDEATVIEPEKYTAPKVSAENVSALAKATMYANTMDMSRDSVHEQLVSEYGEKFKPAAANYAMEHVKADWKKNALAKAKMYQNEMDMSPAAIRDQLVSEYGEKFTESEANYAMENLNS